MDPTKPNDATAAPLSVSATLSLAKECKHSARFDACDPVSEMVVGTLYLDKQAWMVLNRPSKILIKVERA